MVTVVGIGPGSKDYLTPIVLKKVKEAELLMGSSRALGLFGDLEKERIEVSGNYQEIVDYIVRNHAHQKIVFLVTGDPGLFSFLSLLRKKLSQKEIEIIPNISAAQLLFARLGLTWDSVQFLTLHGRNEPHKILPFLRNGQKVCVFTDSFLSPDKIAQFLLQSGVGARAVIGENLSYPQERLIDTDLHQLKEMNFQEKITLLYLEPHRSKKSPNSQGHFYGVGVGPGEPELITLKAQRVLREVDAVFIPISQSKKRSLAEEIVKEVLRPDVYIQRLLFPMSRNESQLKNYWKKAARTIHSFLAKGKDVAFITLGDPLLYSTYIYLLNTLRELDSSVNVQTIPGVSSLSASAAASGVPLAKGDEKLAVLPASRSLQDIKEALSSFDTVVLLKVASRLPPIVRLLEEMNLEVDIVFASHVGNSDECIEMDLQKLKSLPAEKSYLSTMIIRRKKL